MAAKVPDRHVRIEMHIIIEMDDGKRSNLVFCRNLSEGGLFLECVDMPRKGTLVKLEFTLPHNKAKLRVSGRVVWTSQERRQAAVPGVGIKFEGVTDTDKHELNRAVDYLKNLKKALTA